MAYLSGVKLFSFYAHTHVNGRSAHSMHGSFETNNGPMLMGARKFICSKEAVTTGLRAWHQAAMPPALSICLSKSPPCMEPDNIDVIGHWRVSHDYGTFGNSFSLHHHSLRVFGALISTIL
jgi:hypothetical protein